MLKLDCSDEHKDMIRNMLVDEKVKQEKRLSMSKILFNHGMTYGMSESAYKSLEEKQQSAEQDLEDLEELFRMFK